MVIFYGKYEIVIFLLQVGLKNPSETTSTNSDPDPRQCLKCQNGSPAVEALIGQNENERKKNKKC